MRVKNIIPREGYVVVRMQAIEEKTESGIALAENDDDLILHGEIVCDSGDGFHTYPLGATVIFHCLEVQTFTALDSSDTSQRFGFLQEKHILGTYVRE